MDLTIFSSILLTAQEIGAPGMDLTIFSSVSLTAHEIGRYRIQGWEELMLVVESSMAGGRKEVALAAIAVITTVMQAHGTTKAVSRRQDLTSLAHATTCGQAAYQLA